MKPLSTTPETPHLNGNSEYLKPHSQVSIASQLAHERLMAAVAKLNQNPPSTNGHENSGFTLYGTINDGAID